MQYHSLHLHLYNRIEVRVSRIRFYFIFGGKISDVWHHVCRLTLWISCVDTCKCLGARAHFLPSPRNLGAGFVGSWKGIFQAQFKTPPVRPRWQRDASVCAGSSAPVIAGLYAAYGPTKLKHFTCIPRRIKTLSELYANKYHAVEEIDFFPSYEPILSLLI